MGQYDQTFDIKINVGHCDLCFIVHWFCLIYWRLFDIWKSVFGILSQYDPTCDRKLNVVTVMYISWPSDFAFTSWRLFDVWTSYFGIMGQYNPIFDLKINVGHCDLYFVVQWFLSYIAKAIWMMSVIFSDNETVWCDPNFDHKVNIGQHDIYFKG